MSLTQYHSLSSVDFPSEFFRFLDFGDPAFSGVTTTSGMGVVLRCAGLDASSSLEELEQSDSVALAPFSLFVCQLSQSEICRPSK